MFTTKHNECVGFESRWKVIKVSQESATETTEFSTSNQQCSTNEKRDCDTQTDPVEVKLEVEDADEAYMQKLSKWLNDIYPQVKRVMDDVSNGKAFEGYRLASEDTDLTCKLLQTLTLPLPKDVANILNDTDDDEKTEKIKANLLTWNCTGSILAAAILKDHKNWCRHLLATVYLYYECTKNNVKLMEATPKKLNLSCCVVALRFHTNQAAILAVATYAGEIQVCNVAKSNDADVLIKIQAHKEPITHLMWINDLNSETISLMTSATDGLLKLFAGNLMARSKIEKLTLRTVYKIKPPLFNKFKRPLGQIDKNAIVCFDFSKLARDNFVVALEGGRLVQCSLLGAAQLTDSTYDPVVRHFATAFAINIEILQVCFSETRADIFAALGADGAVRLYVLNQEEVAQVVPPIAGLAAISWVPHVDKIIVSCGGGGRLKKSALRLFDVTTAEEIDIGTDAEAVKDDLLMLAVSPSERGRLIASTDNRGRLQLWEIPWHVFH